MVNTIIITSGLLIILSTILYFLFINSKPKIDIELVPLQAQGFNVRARVSKQNWEKICTVIHKEATKTGRYKCQVCGENGLSQGFKHPVECHEVWEYDDSKRTQKLVGMLSLCPLCHKAKHIGLATQMGYGDKVKNHMAKHNGWTPSKVERHIKQSFKKIKSRSSKFYKLDLTYLNDKRFSFLMEKFTVDENKNCDTTIKY